MKKKGTPIKDPRRPLVYKNPENYLLPSIIRAETPHSMIAAEVAAFYETRYGGEGLAGVDPVTKEAIKASGMDRRADAFGGGVGPVGGGVGGQVSVTIPQPYIPEYASPDRLYFPTDPRQAMKYWRYFYALDPVCGNVIDMYAEMLQSDFELAGEDIDAEIKDKYWAAVKDTNAMGLFRWMIVGYLVDGEVVPNLIWDDDENRWVYLGFQDPLNLKVFDLHFANTTPLLELEVSPNVQKVLMNPDPKFEKFRESVPDDLLEMIQQGKGITLNSDDNVTFIPRRLSAYDDRGISIFSRLWRVLIYEDAVFNANIQVARRHAAPLRIAKLGNPATGYIPGPEMQAKVKQMLAITETDPLAWFVWNYGISFESFGTTDRVLSISREWDIIERIKLIALGVSKAFITGEVTYCVLDKNAMVHTREGSYKNICDITQGDYVADRFGQYQEVEEALRFVSPNEATALKVYGGKTFEFTNNHRLPVFAQPRVCACGCGKNLKEQGGRRWKSFLSTHLDHSAPGRWFTIVGSNAPVARLFGDYEPYKEMEAQDVLPGDYLMIPRKFECNNTPITEATRSAARFLGYYLAKGNISHHKNGKTVTLVLSFGNKEKEKFYADDAADCLRSLGLEGQVDQYESAHNCYRVTCKGEIHKRNEFVSWIEKSGGCYAQNKCFSREIMEWPLELKLELIRGMFRGDGHFTQKRNKATLVTDVVLSSVSEILIRQTELILVQLGYASTVFRELGTEGYRYMGRQLASP